MRQSRGPLVCWPHTHWNAHTCPSSGPCVLFPLATEVQYLSAGRQNKYPSPLLCRSLPSFSLPDSFTPACLSIPHRIPFPSMFPLCNFYHLSSPSSIFLSISLFLMPSLCPVHTLTRLSASLDTHHSPCLLFPLTAFVVGRKSDFSPPPLSLHLLNSPTPAPPLLPARLHPFTPPPTFTIGPHSRWSTHTHSTGVKVKGCSCLNKEMGGGRKGERWRGRRVTHSLASLSAVGRGSSSLGCGGYFDGLVRVWGRGAMARCFGLSYTVWNSSCCTSFSHSVYSLWLQQM